MENKIKRYDFTITSANDSFMKEWNDGEYVLFSDYQALEQKYEALKFSCCGGNDDRIEKKGIPKQHNQQPSQKEILLNHIAELDKFADQLLMMEEYQDRLNGSDMKENLEIIRSIIEESVL